MSEPKKPNTITDIIKPELPNLMAILSLRSDKDTGNLQTLAVQELNFLEQHAATKPVLLQCEPSSIVLAVKSVLSKNLSLDPSAGLVYVKTRTININAGLTDVKPVWKKVLEIQETVNGIISYTRQLGRLLDYTNPKIAKDASGKVIEVSMRILKPSYPEPRWEEYSYDESDFERWRKFSHKENSKGYRQGDSREAPNEQTLNWANALYTSWKGGVDPEFARAKCLRHSLKKLGSNSNEGLIPLPVQKRGPVIDANIALAEAEEDQLYDPHEELNSKINETTNKIQGGNPAATQGDFTDDL